MSGFSVSTCILSKDGLDARGNGPGEGKRIRDAINALAVHAGDCIRVCTYWHTCSFYDTTSFLYFVSVSVQVGTWLLGLFGSTRVPHPDVDGATVLAVEHPGWKWGHQTLW